MTSDLEARRKAFRGCMLIPKILFVLPELFRFNVSAEVIELLWPFVNEFDGQENHAAQDGGQHVPPVGAIFSHLERRPREHHRDSTGCNRRGRARQHAASRNFRVADAKAQTTPATSLPMDCHSPFRRALYSRRN